MAASADMTARRLLNTEPCKGNFHAETGSFYFIPMLHNAFGCNISKYSSHCGYYFSTFGAQVVYKTKSQAGCDKRRAAISLLIGTIRRAIHIAGEMAGKCARHK